MISRHLLTSLSPPLFFKKRFNTHPSLRRPLFVKDVYLNIGYTAPFQESEKIKILDALNSLSERGMNAVTTKVASKKIITHRESYGKFTCVEQLLDVQKFGPRVLEKLCRQILNIDSVGSFEDETKTQDLKKLKLFFEKDVKPKPSMEEGMSNVISLKVNVQNVVYSYIDKNQQLLNWAHIPGIKNSLSQVPFVHHELFKMVKSVVEEIPEADVYVLEDMTPIMPKDTFNINKQKMHLASFRTSLITQILLRSPKKTQVHTMKPSVLDHLFSLKVGTERVAITPNFAEILGQKLEGAADDSPLCNVGEENWGIFVEQPSRIKEMFAASLLQAIAFNHLCSVAQRGMFRRN